MGAACSGLLPCDGGGGRALVHTDRVCQRVYVNVSHHVRAAGGERRVSIHTGHVRPAKEEGWRGSGLLVWHTTLRGGGGGDVTQPDGERRGVSPSRFLGPP